MSRDLFKAEIGFSVDQENGNSLAYILSGTAAPDGTSGKQSDAPIGSIYLRSGTGELYQKIANSAAPGDWLLNGSSSATIGKWRNETVSIVTNDTQAAGTRDIVASPFADDDGSVLLPADFIVGEYVIVDADGTPVLMEITAKGGTGDKDITFAAAAELLVAEDTFIVKNYLPDGDGGENRALVNYNGSVILKLSDIDWQFATGIDLSSGYSAGNGSITTADSVESSIQKLDGNQQDIQTVLGVAQGATVLGAFAAAGSIFLGAALTIKSALQKLADVLAGLRGVQVTGITAATTVDSVPHASVKAVKWLIEAFEEATPNNRKAYEVFALTNGSAVDDTVYAKLKVGSNFNVTIDVDISGPDMRLRASSSTAGITVTARRIEVVKDVL